MSTDTQTLIPLDVVVERLDDLISEVGDDTKNDECEYVVEGKAHCIVGVLLDDLGLLVTSSVALTFVEGLNAEVAFGHGHFTPDAEGFLEGVQAAADAQFSEADIARRTWREAYDFTLTQWFG